MSFGSNRNGFGARHETVSSSNKERKIINRAFFASRGKSRIIESILHHIALPLTSGTGCRWRRARPLGCCCPLLRCSSAGSGRSSSSFFFPPRRERNYISFISHPINILFIFSFRTVCAGGPSSSSSSSERQTVISSTSCSPAEDMMKLGGMKNLKSAQSNYCPSTDGRGRNFLSFSPIGVSTVPPFSFFSRA